MTVANNLFEQVAIKRETSFGVPDTDADNAILLNRVEFSPKFDQSITNSAEINTSMQTENYARGVKSSTATLKTEMRAGAYKEIWAALLRKDFTTSEAATYIAPNSTDVAAVAHVNNLTRSSGSFVADGFDVGDRIKFEGFTDGNKSNNGKFWYVIALAAGSMKLAPYYGGAYVMLADAAGEAITITRTSGTGLVITSSAIAAVADVANYTTVAGDFTTLYQAGDIIKTTGWNDSNAPNNGKPFKLTKVTATGLYGYNTDRQTVVIDDADSVITISLAETKMVYSSVNLLSVDLTTLNSLTSFIAEGFKVHDVVRLSGFPRATNNNRNLLITNLSPDGLTMTFQVLDEDVTTVPMVTQSAASVGFVYRVGTKAFIPQDNHINRSFATEIWHDDNNQSELYTGMRVNMAKITVGNTGIPTVDFDFIGKDIVTAQTQHYLSSNEAVSSNNLDSIFGRVRINAGVEAGCVTSMDLTISANLSALDKCIGEDTAADIAAGIYTVSGSMQVYFEDETMRDRFLNKEEMSMVFVFRDNDDYDADFIALQLPRVVYNSATNSGGSKQTLTIPFTAFQNPTGFDGAETDKIKSTFSIQDSIVG